MVRSRIWAKGPHTRGSNLVSMYDPIQIRIVSNLQRNVALYRISSGEMYERLSCATMLVIGDKKLKSRSMNFMVARVMIPHNKVTEYERTHILGNDGGIMDIYL